MANPDDIRKEFIDAAIWHGSLERAEEILAGHPKLASGDIHTAAILGDAAAVRRFLAQDARSATTKAPPYDGEPLVYLCLSKYLRLGQRPADEFLDAAAALMDAGADPNGGFWTTGKFPEFETPLYGAAGVAHHAQLTRLLVARGADPNDGEAAYHTPESYDLGALEALVESGRLTQDSLAIMLLRKCDWHDLAGVKYLLEHRADPNRLTQWGKTALHQAVLRDNSLDIVQALLDHGADPLIEGTHPEAFYSAAGKRATALAARRGRGDVLAALARRGFAVAFEGVERLIAACAQGDAAQARAIAEQTPALVSALVSQGGTLLAEFAGNGNAAGVGVLLDLGVDVQSLYAGDGYFDIPADSTALHVAAWRARHETVKLLIARGAAIDARDGRGLTPIELAVKACVDSYWADRRSPESVATLLAAGAKAESIVVPTGYAEVDALLSERSGQ